MTFEVKADFRARTSQGETFFRKGQILDIAEAKAEALVRAGTITKIGPCHICGEYAWWVSIHGALVCAVCHPPASPALVKKWLGDPACYAMLKASKPGVLLSFEDFRSRLQNASNDR